MRGANVAPVLLLIALAAAPAMASGQLDDPKLRSAAVKCQALIEQVAADAAASKLQALDGCVGAALSCALTKSADPECLAAAGSTCQKLLNAAAGARAKAQAKIVGAKSCGSTLRLGDLLDAEGLGLGEIVGQCGADFDLKVCAGLDQLAECIVRTQDRDAGILYRQVQPRTGELLGRLPVSLPAIPGVPIGGECQHCDEPPGDPKAIEVCGRALTKASQALSVKLEDRLGACSQGVFACSQGRTDRAVCLGKAQSRCNKDATKVSALLAKFSQAVDKRCREDVIALSRLAAPTGLGFERLGPMCRALGVDGPSSAGELSTCLGERIGCQAAALVQQSVPRVFEFAADGQLGDLTDELTEVCPIVETREPRAVATGAHAFVSPFGSITKLIRRVRGVKGGAGWSRPGTRPPSNGTGGGVVMLKGPPQRVTFGGIVKIPFTYRLGSGAPVRQGRAADAPPTAPTLIVSVEREDLAFDDYFEVPLEPAAPGTEVSDEIEITYEDEFSLCAFSIAIATEANGDVSEYAARVQVIDPELPLMPVPSGSASPPPATGQSTPTITPSPTPTGTATPGPVDLVASALAPSTGVRGRAYTLSWTVRNAGGTAVPRTTRSTDRVYFSKDDQLDVSDELVTEFRRDDLIAVGGEYTVTVRNRVMPDLPDGTYFLILFVDAGLEVKESDEANISKHAVELTSIDVAAAAVGPATATAGQLYQLNWRVRDVGTAGASADSWLDRVYLSSNATYETSDRLLAAARNRGVAPHDEYLQSATIGFPNVPAGDYYLILRGDDQDVIREPDATNDTIAAAIHVDTIDLAATAVTAANGVAGQPVALSWTVKNVGTGASPAGGWSDRVYLSDDATLDSGDRIVVERTIAHGVGAGESYGQPLPNSAQIFMPEVASGTYHLIVKVDAGNAVFEQDESNNVAETTIDVRAIDLVPTSFDAGNAIAGQAIALSWTVRNDGNGPSPGSGRWSDAVYLSRDATLDPNVDTLLRSYANPEGLDADGHYDQTTSVDLPLNVLGDYYLILAVDRGEKLFEANEANNVRAVAITIGTIDLTPTALGPSTAASGKDTLLTWTVRNSGNAASPGVKAWNDEVSLTSDATGAVYAIDALGNPKELASNETYDRSHVVRLPVVPPGNYQLKLVVDRAKNVPEPNRDNNTFRVPIAITP